MASSYTLVLESLLRGLAQDTRLLRLTAGAGVPLLAECVRGEEGISVGFKFTVSALSTDANIGLRSLIGQPALLELLTAGSHDILRPFHGYITGAEFSGANGGLGRYQLTIEPWLAFLGHGRDCRVFQDMTVPDIVDVVLAGWRSKGRLVPAWRFDLADPALYPRRSLTTQYQESDLAFLQRLLLDEGLFFYFEHAGDAHSATLGLHTMVIADHNGSFQPNLQANVEFSQPGAVMKADKLDRWRAEYASRSNAIELASWDYRIRSTRPVQEAAGGSTGSTPVLALREPLGGYAYGSGAQGQRRADHLMQALAARREVFVGAGTVRTLAPGTTFHLHGHARHDAGGDDERHFLAVRAVHLMHNNLSAALKAEVDERLPQSALAAAILAEQAHSLHTVGSGPGERPLYRVRVDAIRAAVPYRACSVDRHGALMFPAPVLQGQQTAIVVGPAGSVVHTDRDHRVKIQFHWQRGSDSHSRLDHPSPDGHSGAPADDTAGTWVRVATSIGALAGANWGSHAVPRVGQEVLVDFLDGDIDRPVVVSALYNGRGERDAQGNGIGAGAGAATANAPAWFPGEGGGHAHPAVLSGFKSQAMATSQSGTGAYSQLVFDDSAGQSRVSLQRHATAHGGTDELNLGQLRHQTDNQRMASAGFGAELKTNHSAALRAGKGMLLSAHIRPSSDSQMDAREAAAQLDLSSALQTTLADSATKHHAILPGQQANLAALDDLAHTAQMIQQRVTGPDASAAAFGEPVLQLSAPDGIVATTPASAIIASNASSSITAGQDINVVAQGDLLHGAKEGISLFTDGKAGNGTKPNQETGVRLHAATGNVSAQSQAGETRLTADKTITVASTTQSVSIRAKEHVLLTAQGAFIRLEGGNISIHGPGRMTFKASMKQLDGPSSAPLTLPNLPKSQEIIDAAERPFFSQQINAAHYIGLFPELAGMPYEVWHKDKDIQIAAGQLDPAGLSSRVFTDHEEQLSLIVGDASWEIITPEFIDPHSGKED